MGSPIEVHLPGGDVDEADFAEVADIIATALVQGASGSGVDVEGLRTRVRALTDAHPLYAGLTQ